MIRGPDHLACRGPVLVSVIAVGPSWVVLGKLEPALRLVTPKAVVLAIHNLVSRHNLQENVVGVELSAGIHIWRDL